MLYLCRSQVRGGDCNKTHGLQAYGILHYQGAPKEIPTSRRDDELPIPNAVFNPCTNIKDYVGITDLNYIGKIPTFAQA